MRSFETELRRAAWKQNVKIFVIGVVVIALGIGFLFVYGDPAGHTESGRLDVELFWRTDGTLEATVRTPFRSRADNERVADVIVPALLGADTPVSVSFPEDKGGTHSITARTLTPASPPENGLELSTTDLVHAAQQIGMTAVDFSVDVPRVPASVESTAPATRWGTSYVWNDIQDIDALTISASLRPSVRSWVVQTTVLVTIALGILGIGLVTGRRALRGRLPERRARRRYAIGMGLSAAGLLWSLRVEGTVDDPYIVWHLGGVSLLAAHWATTVLWLFVGGWITFALFASGARDRVRMSYPPPPTSALPSP